MLDKSNRGMIKIFLLFIIIYCAEPFIPFDTLKDFCFRQNIEFLLEDIYLIKDYQEIRL